MNFSDLGLGPRFLDRLAEAGLTDPTPIQSGAIPHALKGRDVLGLAQTGTGKTLAFGLPLLTALAAETGRPAAGAPTALILAPTRELARQIADSLAVFTRGGPTNIALVTGGNSMRRQAETLRRGVHLVVATPGRLIDLIEREALSLGRARFLVLDEADQMLDLGFIHALRRIASLLPAGRQTMLFSATMPKQMESLAASYLREPVRVEVAPPGKPVEKIEQSVHFVPQTAKAGYLGDLLAAHPGERALVFARTKHGAERLMKQLDRAGFAAASIHGNKSQGQRDRALQAFREGRTLVLVATDVAARGIDIPGVAYVYNHDLPDVPETYVHRIGRTARAGADGRAVALCAEGEIGNLAAIEKTLGRQIETAGGARPAASAPSRPAAAKGRPRRRRGGNSGATRRAA